MIVFDGYLTGKAYKYYINKIIRTLSNTARVIMLLSIPFWLIISLKTSAFIPVISTLLIYIALLPLVVKACFTPKEKKRMNLKKVVINVEDGDVKYISDKSIVCNYISKVKEVRDYGEYYDVVFPLQHLTSVFVCQKSLLSKGSLEEFERIFEGKIKRINKDS